jgi:hypothetical protein
MKMMGIHEDGTDAEKNTYETSCSVIQSKDYDAWAEDEPSRNLPQFIEVGLSISSARELLWAMYRALVHVRMNGFVFIFTTKGAFVIRLFI